LLGTVGDVGELIGPGQFNIIDRCKSHFKLNQGVFVAPEPIELLLAESDLVRNIFVWGNSFMTHTAAVVVPSAKAINIDGIVNQDSIHILLQKFREIGSTRGLKPHEIPQHVLLEMVPWTIESGLITALGKLCRPALIRSYQERLCQLANIDSKTGGHHSAFEHSSLDTRGICRGLIELLQECGCNIDGKGSISEQSVVSLGMDSLAVARLSSKIRDRFGTNLSPRNIYLISTLADLEAACFGGDIALKRVAMKGSIVDLEAEIEKQVGLVSSEVPRLRAELRGDPSRFSASTNERNVIFLTGATGFLGSFILRSLALLGPGGKLPTLVEFENCEIMCLVRSSDDEEAARRLQSVLSLSGLDLTVQVAWAPVESSSQQAARRCIRAIAGDLSENLFKFKPEQFEYLASRVKIIIHCGACVSSFLPYSVLEKDNVGATRRILELLLLFDDAKSTVDLWHISTLGVIPAGFPETPLWTPYLSISSSHLSYLNGGYSQSKYVAEQLVTRVAMQTDRCPRKTVIFRPGTIFGDSESGISNTKDAVNLMFCGLIREGLVCVDESPLPESFNLCPVDYVAMTLVQTGFVMSSHLKNGTTKSAKVCVIHLCSSQNLSLKDMVMCLRLAGYGLNEVSSVTFQKRLSEIQDEKHPLFYLKASFSRPSKSGTGQPNRRTSISQPIAQKAHEILSSAKINISYEPRINSESLRKSITYLQKVLNQDP